jgi:hypothetical protein
MKLEPGDRSLDSLKRSSEKLIQDLETGSGGYGSPTTLPDSIAQDLDAQVAVPLESFTEPSTDGQFGI